MDGKLLSLILALTPAAAFAQNVQGPLGDPLPAPMRDPTLPRHSYAPSVSTAEVADAGPALSSVTATSARGAACAPTNPCALATPARDRAAAVKPGPSPDR